MPRKHLLNCIAYASGLGAGDNRSSSGPSVLQTHLKKNHLSSHWVGSVQPTVSVSGKAALPEVARLSLTLSEIVHDLVQIEETFMVIGGDHTTAIGTWTGAADGLKAKGDIGLIWIDAHMDSHTPQTTPSQNIHGMPVATLLGHGYPELTYLTDICPALKPQNVCLIGVRSYEPEEPLFLSSLGVRVFLMEEVKRKGFEVVLQEALEIVNQHTVGYGMSLDVDAFDPKDFPATGIQVADGLHFIDVCASFKKYIASDERFLGIDIAEFIPALDLDHTSANKLIQLIKGIFPHPV